jgi:MOSC domain-containing protein YiiM
MTTNKTLLSLNASAPRAERLAGGAAYARRPAGGRRRVRAFGLEGDEPAERLSQALSAYPSEHYGFWQTVRAQAGVADWDMSLAPGSLGETLTLAGLLEGQLWIGDRLRFPDCELAVSAPRLPEPGLDAALGFRHASRLMAQSAWCGFYLMVLRPGSLEAGEPFELVAGPREIGVVELFRARIESRGT